MSSNTNNYTGNRSTMERIAAHIPGTTEHAERQHPNLTRQGRGHLNTAQATAGVPPNVNPNVNQAVPVPATQQQFAAPTTAHQPALHQGPANSGLGPTTGQKISGKAKAGMGRLMGNPRMEAQGIQKATGGAYVPSGTTAPQPQQQQAGGYPPATY